MGLMQTNEIAASRLPEPEEVFLSWLLAQPPGRDLAAAADMEIVRLRAYAGPYDGPKRLAEIFSRFRASLDLRECGRLH